MAVRRLSILALAAVLVLAGSEALAQDKRAARTHLRAGDRAFKKAERLAERDKAEDATAQYEAALGEYLAAYEALPNPRIYFPIAMTEERLGRYLDAYRHYRQILDETDDLDDELRAQVEVRIEEVKQSLAVVEFDVQPEGATVAIDGEELGTAPLPDPVVLAPGDYVFLVTAEGHRPYEAEVSVAAGEQPMQMVALEPIEIAPEVVADPEPPPAPPSAPAGVDNTRLYIGLGATGGLATLATISGLIALSKHGDFEDGSLPAGEREDARDSGETWSLAADILWVGAVAAGAYTAYYYYTDYRVEKAAAEGGQALYWAPYATPEGAAGIAVGGEF